MSHPDEGIIQALLDGELESAERARIEAHVAACPACAARLDEAQDNLREADRLVELLTVPPRPAAKPVRGRPMAWQALAWAASIALAVAIGYWGRGVPMTPRVRLGDETVGARADQAVTPSVAEAPVPTATPMRETPKQRRTEAPAEEKLLAANEAEAPALGWRVVVMEEAVAQLGGQIRLIDGLTPDRVEVGPGTAVAGADAGLPVVRVSYARGTVVLDQQRPSPERARMEGAPAPAAKAADAAAATLQMAAPHTGWRDLEGIRFVVTGAVSAESLATLAGRVR